MALLPDSATDDATRATSSFSIFKYHYADSHHYRDARAAASTGGHDTLKPCSTRDADAELSRLPAGALRPHRRRAAAGARR